MSTIIENKRVSQNFIPPETIELEEYVLGDGNLAEEIVLSGGNWANYLPLGEDQAKNGIDPRSCTAAGTLNALEAIGKLKYGASFQSDLSERYLSVMGGMNGQGGNPHFIAEELRTRAGSVPEVFLPFGKSVTTLQKYFSPNPMSYYLFKVGRHWNQKYIFKHQWVFAEGTIAQKQNALKEGLRYSPIGVSGYAWSLHSDGKYYKDGPDIHWFIVYGYVEGEYWLAFDTYFPYVKRLDWNYDFGYAKSYTLNKRLGVNGDWNESEVPEKCRFEYIKYLFNHFFK